MFCVCEHGHSSCICHLLYAASSSEYNHPPTDGYMKRQRLALRDQDDFTALKSIKSQKTIWTSAGQRLQPPAGEIFVFSFQARLPRTGVMSREWRVGG